MRRGLQVTRVSLIRVNVNFEHDLRVIADFHAVKEQAAKWGPRMILVEDAASGIAIQQMLRRETRLPVVPVPAFRGGKLSHAQSNTPYVEGGRVRFGPGAYLTEFEHELLSFPTGTHDDQVDAFNILLTRIFNVALKRATSTDGSGRPDRAPTGARERRRHLGARAPEQ